jgi:hypothetical protein
MKKSVCFLASLVLALASTNARTQQGISDGVVKIGLIEDSRASMRISPASGP